MLIVCNMFVTCFYAILDPKSATLSYANAGHTLPCCKWHDEDQADELRVRGMPLGLMPGMLYEEKETTLLAGDGVLFCTDGLVEAHDPGGECSAPLVSETSRASAPRVEMGLVRP